jgi:predicted O-linked N-acetylglucosamine transferase (SPINDLY family)
MNDAQYQNAVRAHQAGKLGEAAQLYAEILRAEPRHFPALFSLGYLNLQTGRFEDAQRLLGEALRLNANSPDALFLRGSALQQLKRAAEALQCFDRALALKPNFPEAHSGRAAALKSLGRHDARPTTAQASTVPESAAAAYVRACALAQANQLEDSLAEFGRAVAIAPQFVEALCNRGAVLLALKRPGEAVQSFDAALQVSPSFFEALNNRGNALSELGRFEEAVASYDRALMARPNAFEVLLNRGNALLSAHRGGDALTSYEQALTAQPDNAPALKGRANALFELGRFEEAIGGFEAALARDPAQPYSRGDLIFSKLQCCDWSNLNEERTLIITAVNRGDAVINPFEFLALPASPDEQRDCASIWVREKYPAAAPLWRGEAYGHDRIRVAYLSANFHNHAVGQAISGVLEKHDRARFEIVGLSWGPDDGSAARARIAGACDRFIDISRQNDGEAARLVRQMEIDIIVDLMGFTAEHRTGILAARAAPIQVNYLGYAGTMAAPYVDYLIADSVVIPDEERICYSERIVTLPGSYLPVDDTRVVGPALSRSTASLPDDAFVFVCFNNSYKFVPEVFDVWMRLLQRTERSVLWLSRVNAAAARNLAREASDRGVDPSRLIFAPFVANPADHLMRLAAADLFLDTLPYNAHATAVDALLAGVPVVTCKGQSFAGRVGSSLLHAAGMTELVTNSLEDYEALALELAADRTRLAALKTKLTAARHTQPLFDTSRYTKSLEQAYLEMLQPARTASIS